MTLILEKEGIREFNMGNKGKRLGRSNVIWWPSVRTFLQNNTHEFFTSQEIIESARLVSSNGLNKPLYRSRSCPNVSTLGRFLKLQKQVERKIEIKKNLHGGSNKAYTYRWIEDDSN